MIDSIFPQKKVKYLNYVVNGSTPKSSEEEFWDGEILWVTPEDLSKSDNPKIYNTKRKITEKGYHSCGTTLCPKGSIVLSTRAPIGSIGIASTFLCTNQGCKTLVPKDESYSKYEFYQLSVSSELLNSLGKGTTFKELSSEDLKNYVLINPPLKTQKKIADFLDKETTRIDTLISKKQKQIELLQEKRQAIITQSVTKGLNPDVKMKDSGVEWIGEIPEHWNIVPLKRLLKVKDGTHDTPESVTESQTSRPLVTSKNVVNGKVDIENANHISYEDYLHVIKRSDATKDDVIMPMIGTIGNPCILDVDGYLAVKNIAIFKTSESIVPSRFMKYLLESNFITTQFGLLSRGGVQDFVSLTVLNNILIPMMGQDEYIKITDYLRDQSKELNTLMDKIQKSIHLLKEYRSSLITHAVSGQIDITEFTKDTGGV